MRDYASPTPIDRYGNVLQGTVPATTAIATNVNGAKVSSIIALNGNTTMVEVTATGTGGAVIKWIGSVIGTNPHPSVTTANFDAAVSENTTQRFVVPQSIMGMSTGSVIGGYGKMSGCYTLLGTLALSTASILVVEK